MKFACCNRMTLYAMIVAAVLVTLTAHVAMAQGADKTMAALLKARADYDAAVDGVGKALLKELDAREDKARRGGKRDAVAQVNAERDALTAHGEWPNLTPMPQLRTRMETARKKMIGAYEAAAKAYLMEKRDALCDRCNDELKAFRSENDLAPWRDLAASVDPARDTLMGSWTRDGNALLMPAQAKQSALKLGGPVPDEYRLEIRTRRISGGGGLVLGVVTSDQQRMELALDDNAANEARVVGGDGKPIGGVESVPRTAPIFSADKDVCISLTVRAGRVTLEADGSRLLSWSAGEGELADVKRFQLDARTPYLITSHDQTRFRLESVRLKPLGAAKELVKPVKKEAKPALVERDKAKSKGPRLQELMPVNSRWRGTRKNDVGNLENGTPTCGAIVVRHVGEGQVVLRTTEPGNFGMHWTLESDGKAVRVIGLEETDDRHGHRALEDGSGNCNGKKLQLRYRWRLTFKAQKNQQVQGWLNLEREQ